MTKMVLECVGRQRQHVWLNRRERARELGSNDVLMVADHHQQVAHHGSKNEGWSGTSAESEMEFHEGYASGLKKHTHAGVLFLALERFERSGLLSLKPERESGMACDGETVPDTC